LLFCFSADLAASGYVGSEACKECHTKAYETWQGSHHQQAMDVATEKSVLGDFNDTTFTYNDVTTRFYYHDGKYKVFTDDLNGKMREFEVSHTFGVYPLQQYLISTEGGRLQAFSIAWDSRSITEGGQRWFHLYPDQGINHQDPLHWTGIYHNWNYMCAECHSTELIRNYDPESDTYDTHWAEISIGCEACHGSGERHLAWAQKAKQGIAPKKTDDMGLEIRFQDRTNITWEFVDGRSTAVRSQVRTTKKEEELCAGCHARRGRTWPTDNANESFHDRFRLQLLTEGSYHPDGQMIDEVYVYGSFLQSRMHQVGVTCSDCHEPHAQTLRVTKGQDSSKVCLQCHLASTFATQKHHHHQPGSQGASCVECHMPPANFMVVDARHDHSFRIPRPDLSVQMDTPNACNRCHDGQSPQWAADTIKRWYDKPSKGLQSYAVTLHNARRGHPLAEKQLIELADNTNVPAITRATAIAELRDFLDQTAVQHLPDWLSSDDALIRRAAVDLLEPMPDQIKWTLGHQALNDNIRTVRQAAAGVLAGIHIEAIEVDERAAFKAALDEYRTAQTSQLDRPEAYANLGNFERKKGHYHKAQEAYLKALALQPQYFGVRINLADIYREQGDEKKSAKVLLEGLELAPNNPILNYALGLQRVREKNYEAARQRLLSAALAAPENAHYSFVYAVALASTGQTLNAVNFLESALNNNPVNKLLLTTAIDYHLKLGNREKAQRYGEQLAKLKPDDPSIRRLLKQ